jgi:hypothetical protein
MKKRLAAAIAVGGMSFALLGVAPATGDEVTRRYLVEHCKDPAVQQAVAENTGVQANHGQCMKVLSAFLP